MDGKEFLEAMLEAYNLGAWCAKEVNSGRKWTEAKSKTERAALNKILERFGMSKLTDAEYADFNR
jgi:hypothetical protein